ncbi:MAG: hypothetical protein VKP57_02070 [Candidatus Sericytochromatia bacterium]|nr:hypothetical protein [Candidatus Sericytochromatia bacterium]
MRRHVVRALLLASLTGCDAQAVKSLLATTPAVDGKASDASATDANKGPATPADIAANLLARLAAVDVAAKVGKVARPAGNAVQAPTAGGAGSTVPMEGAPLQPGADGSLLAGDPTRLPQPGFAPMPMPEAVALPPMASMPAPPQLEDGWQGMHLDFGSKDFGEAVLIARKLASVLRDARPFAAGGQLEPRPVWSFAFANAKGGFAQVVVTPEWADLFYVAEQSGIDLPADATFDLDAVKVSPMQAVAALRAGLAEGTLQDLPFADDLAPVGMGHSGSVSGSTGSGTAGEAVISKPVPMARRVQSEPVVGTVEGGSTMPAEPVAIPGLLPIGPGSEPPSVSLPPKPELPEPVQTVLREMPAGAIWQVTLQKSVSGQLVWLVNAYPDMAMDAVASPESSVGYPVTKEAVYRRVQDLAAEGGEASSESPVPVEAIAPDSEQGYVGMPAPDDAEGSVPVYPVRDVPMAVPTMTSPSVGYPGFGATVTGWEVRKSSYFQPLAAAVDAVSGRVLALMLPRQVTYFYPAPVYGPPCDACTPVDPMPLSPKDPVTEEPGNPDEPLVEEPPSEEPLANDPKPEDPVTEEPPMDPEVEQPADLDAEAPSPDGSAAGSDPGAEAGAGSAS